MSSTEIAIAKIQFIKALDSLIDYHHGRIKAMTTAAVVPHHNKFIGFFEHVGHDLKVGLPVALKIAETGGEVAVSIFAPAASALFNQTITAIVTAQQNAAALNGGMTGQQKLEAVLQLMGGLIEQGLKDANQPALEADVIHYVEAALTIVKATVIRVPEPAQVSSPKIPLAAPKVEDEQIHEDDYAFAPSGPSLVSPTDEPMHSPSAMDSLLGH